MNKDKSLYEERLILYRPHRGGLDEAMSELKEFKCLNDMIIYLANKYEIDYEEYLCNFDFDRYSEEDARIGWKPVYCIKYCGEYGDGWFTYGLRKNKSLVYYNEWLNGKNVASASQEATNGLQRRINSSTNPTYNREIRRYAKKHSCSLEEAIKKVYGK